MPVALIADDEPTLAEFLCTELKTLWPELKVLPLAYNGQDALRMIDEMGPDIAFLDIRMPGLSGLDVASKLVGSKGAPLLVFVTAFDQYAVEAFEREALDYLLKPPSRERLGKTIEKLKRQLSAPAASLPNPAASQAMLAQLAQLLGQTQASLQWIRAAQGSQTRLISVDEVIYFEAQDKYVSVFTQDGEALIRTSLKELLEGLDPARFWQVHRGTVVNVRHIESTERDLRGRTLLSLKQRKDQLVVSRAYVHLFKQM